MTHPLGDNQAQEQAAFFGQVTASVTHEIKNHLALINEYNGLLSDLLAAHARGRDLDPERLASLSAEVRKQVRLAGEIVGQLNRFAHSVDGQAEEVDLGELAATFTALSARRAQRRRMELSLAPPESSAKLVCQPFLLLLACHCLLEAVLEACPEGSSLTISPGGRAGRPGLVFDCGGAGLTGEGCLPAWLLKNLDASLEKDAGGGVALLLGPAPAGLDQT